MEKQFSYCDYCDSEFEQEHGNDRYCCDEHRDLARKFRQGEKYKGISSLLPVLHHNHLLLEKLSYRKQESFTEEELELEGLDTSLYRRSYPEASNQDWVRLDFGTYYLDTQDNFQTFKLFKHETEIRKAIRSEKTGATTGNE